MSASKVVIVAEMGSYIYKSRKERLADLEDNLALVAQLLGEGCFCWSSVCPSEGLMSAA